jgi:hypothetical protein
MSPSDFGEILKPFAFLDLFDHEGAPFNGGLHPHLGIATLTYVVERAFNYIDPNNVKGTLPGDASDECHSGSEQSVANCRRRRPPPPPDSALVAHLQSPFSFRRHFKVRAMLIARKIS